MDNQPETVDNLGDAPNRPDTPNVSDPSPKLAAMTGLATETRLMKGSEVRDLLHIGKTTLHDWREAGRLTAIRHHARGPWYYPADQPTIENALRAVGSEYRKRRELELLRMDPFAFARDFADQSEDDSR